MKTNNFRKSNGSVMRLRALFIGLFLVSAIDASAQFTFSGKIEYERKKNLHKLWSGDDWLERWKDKFPTFFVNYFNLTFNMSQSRYEPGREVEAPKMTWGLPPGSDNVVHRDFSKGTVTAAKNIYEEHFLIKDAPQKHSWRILTEVRTIAGYKCRKAVTRICDSVYVVAFYTDDIPVSGGPEQMGGLPGMILEIAVPRLYTTWVATRVEVVSVKPSDITAPEKGKAITIAQLTAKLQESLKDWGKQAHRQVWWGVL
jgi:GLPGLI family protein